MIKHVSFDVWNTLISANPEFAKARTQLLADFTDVDFSLAKHEYTKLKQKADNLSERNGLALPTPTLVRILLGSLLPGEPSQDLIRRYIMSMNDLFIEHHPIMPQSVIDLIDELVSAGVTVSIGSNSNFISGKVMHPWINQAVGEKFSFGVYSDLVRVGKPSAAFFGHIIDEVRARRIEVRNTEILHVGDSDRCDRWGASEIGMNALLISDSNSTYNAVINYLTKENHV